MYWCIATLLDIIKVLLICVGIFKIPVIRERIKYIPLIYILISVFLLLKDYNSTNNIYSNVCLLAMMVTVFLVLEKKKYFAVLAYMAEMFVEVLWLVFYSYFNQIPLQEAMENKSLVLTTGLIFSILLGIISVIFHRENTKRVVDMMGVKVSILLAVGILGVCLNIVSVHIVISAEYIGKTFQHRSLIFTTIGTLIFILLIILFFIKDYLTYQYKEKANMVSRILEEQHKYCELLVEKSEETRKIRHDMDNHVICINHLLESGRYDELAEYTHKLGQRVSELQIITDTGNNLIDAMLGELLEKYENVVFKVEGVFPDKIVIPLIDLSTIFYNLFNNAFEAANDSKSKNVSLSIKKSGNSLFVTIVNSVDEIVDIRNNYIQTSKKDNMHHGYGINNARSCIEGFGGGLELNYSDREFKAEVVLLNAFIIEK